MSLNSLYNKGFAPLEAVLFVVVIVLAGGTGYYVYHANKTASSTLASAAKDAYTSPQTKKEAVATTPATIAGWKSYRSPKGGFSLQYPAGWQQIRNPQYCGDILDRDIDLGPDSASVVSCGTDGEVSQVSISSVAGDQRQSSSSTLDSAHYQQISHSVVTVDGVSGTVVTGKAIHQQENEGLGGLPDGTIVIVEAFYSHSTTYTATYYQLPASSKEGPTQDQTSTFQKIVNTLKFE